MIDKDPTRTVNVLMELGTLEPTVNRHIVEKAIEFSIQSLYGKEVDKMEVKALTDLANKTMSRFPFRLPKNLALYMRMASILEGVYQHHKVKFQFVKVLAKILEGEGLLKDAYIEEARTSVYRLGKNIESALNVAPMIQSYLETQLYNNPSNKIQKDRNNTLIAGAILATGLFIGSSIVLPHDINIAYAGFIGSVVTITVATMRKKFW
jgi:predicted unusual protein kinase regulating ubiquinone biosynthesis (AarF/ABC1/UbiB family)